MTTTPTTPKCPDCPTFPEDYYCIKCFWIESPSIVKEGAAETSTAAPMPEPAKVPVFTTKPPQKLSCRGFTKKEVKRGRPAINAECAACGVIWAIHPKN